ncbi:hypothetical protein JCM21142_134743 [Saccharicrinis fermentans DSM 9555 = JCM 21142]|uniref:RHS repeat-associated core domain protein n=1 Tax=Saccharicrinis fermentans DSM 9555 = JCM 21142 TaxID=869213 RepID=W7YET1_9BACT|nr:hypothetical protein JCM21142_134743 [Saccharicrinis fermentans DSM 9555 = JCM 21142]
MIDPKAEKYFHESPFIYAGNNPILFVDPNGEEKYKLQGHLKFNSGFVGIGIKALGIKYSFQGAKEYEVSINISFDAVTKEFTIGGAGLQREKGGDELTAGGVVGGGETTEKETGGEVKIGFNFKEGEFVSDADKIEDEDFKDVGEGTVGIYTGTEKEGEGYKAALGLNPEVNAFYGAGIGINLSVQESTEEEKKEE